jgi:hypothetical protein
MSSILDAKRVCLTSAISGNSTDFSVSIIVYSNFVKSYRVTDNRFLKL